MTLIKIPTYPKPKSENVPITIMPKEKSKRQVGYLLSKGSPLSDTQQAKLKRELHSGDVTVKGKKQRTKKRDPRDVKFY
jgi:hypothetical protein